MERSALTQESAPQALRTSRQAPLVARVLPRPVILQPLLGTPQHHQAWRSQARAMVGRHRLVQAMHLHRLHIHQHLHPTILRHRLRTPRHLPAIRLHHQASHQLLPTIVPHLQSTARRLLNTAQLHQGWQRALPQATLQHLQHTAQRRLHTRARRLRCTARQALPLAATGVHLPHQHPQSTVLLALRRVTLLHHPNILQLRQRQVRRIR